MGCHLLSKTGDTMKQTHEVPRRGYSIEEVAQAYGITRQTLHKKIRAGELETIKIGKRRIITAAALEAFEAKGGAA